MNITIEQYENALSVVESFKRQLSRQRELKTRQLCVDRFNKLQNIYLANKNITWKPIKFEVLEHLNTDQWSSDMRFKIRELNSQSNSNFEKL